VVHWYFAQLDNNGSHDINKKELKPFKRYLKKKAKPKKCARKFTDYCDLNKDKGISLQELKGCLGVSKEGKRRSCRWIEEVTVKSCLVGFFNEVKTLALRSDQLGKSAYSIVSENRQMQGCYLSVKIEDIQQPSLEL